MLAYMVLRIVYKFTFIDQFGHFGDHFDGQYWICMNSIAPLMAIGRSVSGSPHVDVDRCGGLIHDEIALAISSMVITLIWRIGEVVCMRLWMFASVVTFIFTLVLVTPLVDHFPGLLK